MTNLTKLEFVALDITGKNYLSWILDAEIHLDAMGLGDIIKEGNESSNQDKAKAMIFLRHHLHEGLKTKYLIVKDPLTLWENLKERYDHQKTVILLRARYDWMHLHLQDFKSVIEYNSAVFRISSQLKLCGENIANEDMLEKTFSTFHASNVLLQQQYREKDFQKYSELILCLLVVNELLMKNHEACPIGSPPFPEVNVTISNNHRHRRGQSLSLKEKETNIMKANFAYQNENREANFAYQDDNFDHGPVDITHLDVADFFENPEGRIDHLIGDGNVQNY
ncbi:uncharacterized protein LOC116109581 [Pistacia vera]|uniref:uncharacterized protein LOC116109581 n=1 Tax=Pistacia vera TaxID=55513 RepID=UPI001263A129|nr:uncharacterized protein LOC116109581 [Pistacia vera]